MNSKQRLALTIAGSAVALGLFFHKPISNLISKISEEPLYEASYIQYPEPGPGASSRTPYPESQYKGPITKKDLESLYSQERLGLIGELKIRPYYGPKEESR